MSIKQSWINYLFTMSTGSKKNRNLLTPIGALIFGALIFIFISAAVYTDDILNLPNLNLKNWSIIIIPLILTVGFFFVGWSVLFFLKAKGTPVPVNPPSKLVITGPYAYSRNPMLTGIFFLMFGVGFWISSFSLVLIFTPLFILTNVLELKKIEEQELEKRFGQEYIDYKKKTPMFFLSLKFVHRL